MTNVVLVTRNRHRLLAQALESLYTNTPQDQFNLTLVDYGSDDFRAHSIQARYALRTNCVRIGLEGSSTSWAHTRNLGVEASSELFGRWDYFYMSDDDVCFLPGWLDKMTDVAHKSTLRGFSLWGGQVHPFHHPIAEFDGYKEYASLDGPSWLMEWSEWNAYGPLGGEELGPCKGADVAFCDTLIAHKLRIAVVDPPVVIHTGLTNTNGEKAPGYDLRVKDKVPGVLYE